jgi:branched-chain amino acid transport system ATP-binding protein
MVRREPVLRGVERDAHASEVVTLLGRSGAGKSTTLKSIMGLIRQRSGSIRFEGNELIAARSDRIARAGIAFCPEERGIYTSLNVTENLVLPPVLAPGGIDMPTIYTMFPNLKERARSQGSKLSGGEQQMLAIARILRIPLTRSARRLSALNNLSIAARSSRDGRRRGSS